MRSAIHFPNSTSEKNIAALLAWVDKEFRYFAFFDGNDFSYPNGCFPKKLFAANQSFGLDQASELYHKEDMVCLLSYDYKNRVEKLESKNPELTLCPEQVFFNPELTIEIEKDGLTISHTDPDWVKANLLNFKSGIEKNPKAQITALENRDSYQKKIETIQNHIVEGDIYEMNFCMAFEFQVENWNPIRAFLDLMKISPMPFSGLFKSDDQFLICASPERFLKKEKRKFIAQPIKGTIRRSHNPDEDRQLAAQLLTSEKERAENLMIVDLMRNDLSKVSEIGSTKVDELFGVYSFPKVHQMISTVSSEDLATVTLREIIHATFPMGSMTGAPKIRCMQLIDQYENFKRGWFSGTMGYISALGDFDFNVIIRSMIFDRSRSKGYFAVGSAITFDADPEYEFEECLLKAKAIMEVLNPGGNG